MTAVDRMLVTARQRLRRLTPAEAAHRVAAGALLVDVRTDEERRRDGALPGAVRIPLNVLEWRADPTSPHRDPRLGDFDTLLVLVCSEGYCSSLAAARLLDLEREATDVIGGVAAWRDAGLPLVRPEPESG